MSIALWIVTCQKLVLLTKISLIIYKLKNICVNKQIKIMLPANPNILKCPHCNRLMRISSIMSGNTIGMTQWSDAKSVCPMLPRVSPVLRCPVCEKYFFYRNEQIIGMCKLRRRSSWGHLSYKSLKEAFGQLQPNGEDEKTVRLMLLHGYNDHYGGCIGTKLTSDTPADERKFFGDNAKRLIELMSDNQLFCAEIYRELGEFEKSLELLNSITVSANMVGIADQIKSRALQYDSRVFVIVGPRESMRTAREDEKMFVH